MSLLEIQSQTCLQLVIFALAEDQFALPGHQIYEIVPYTKIYFVPGYPPALEGVISVRGDLIPVLGLGNLLGIEQTSPARHAVILLGQSEHAGQRINSGLRVDRMFDVLEIESYRVQAPPLNLPESLQNQVTGVLLHQGASILILDLERIIKNYLAIALAKN